MSTAERGRDAIDSTVWYSWNHHSDLFGLRAVDSCRVLRRGSGKIIVTLTGERLDGSDRIQRNRNTGVHCDVKAGRYGDGEVTESDHDDDDKGKR
jgi:hypothetical protein